MKISYEVSAKITLYKKYADGVINIDHKVASEVDEESEDFVTLCRENESKIGFFREDDPKEFDKKLVVILSEDLKRAMLSKITTIKNVFKDCMNSRMLGTCEIFGTVFNPKDFCAMEVHAIETKCNKK